ncbi:MAG: hypothetical protein Q8K77_04690 [Thermodesulfovibrionales bacterium]|jgi:hypothetical protein|nr:hypothetical protein [Thermodesulfovibrionales bacterium]
MAETNRALNEELLEIFYLVVTDFRHGLIDEVSFTEKLFRIAERYERNTLKTTSEKQKDLF